MNAFRRCCVLLTEMTLDPVLSVVASWSVVPSTLQLALSSLTMMRL